MTRQRTRFAALLLLLAGAVLPAAWAHAPSNATLSLSAEGTTVRQRWDIALRDLDRVLPLDANDDGSITWGELRQAWPQVVAHADSGLRLALQEGGTAGAANAACSPGPMAPPRIDDHANGTYAVLERDWTCPADAGRRGLVVDYRLFADSDASHRGLLRWAARGTRGTDAVAGGATASTAVLVPAAEPAVLAGTDALHVEQGARDDATVPSGFVGFVGEGVHHILIGTDHVLFLLALMLPAVVASGASRNRPRAPDGPAVLRWPQAAWQVAKVVTAFTVAHSITLALAVLGYADPPSRVVEALIAASVVLAAIDNLRRFLPGVRWQLAFGFGLIHGFGFAGALRELGLDEGALARSLLGFNVGVELGQLGIVALVMPLAWWARDTRFYRRVVLAGGSVAIAAVAALWFIERAFDVALITA